MTTYRNGRLPLHALAVVQGAMMAAVATAKDWHLFKVAAKKVGVTLHIAEPAGAYRDWATQTDMLRPARKVFYHITIALSRLARVGNSSHGLGKNLDVYASKPGRDDEAWQWVLEHMADFGFKQRDAKGDPHCLAHK